MIEQKKAVFHWSGGKDSALALQKVLREQEFEVVSLLTTLNETTGHSSVHSIPLEILSRQAASIGIPLYTVLLSQDLKDYDEKMAAVGRHFKEKGVAHFIFGDLFVSGVKAYRESRLNPLGIEVVEPLWDRTSEEIMAAFLESGIRTKIIVTQADVLDSSFVGRELDESLVKSLPEGVDVCGENGEYHTLSYAGDLFREEIGFAIDGVRKISYAIRLDSGAVETFEYWQGLLRSSQ